MKKILFLLLFTLLLAGCAKQVIIKQKNINQPVPNQNQTECNTNSDCQNGSSCMVEGPLIAGQPIHKVCVPKGQAVPL